MKEMTRNECEQVAESWPLRMLDDVAEQQLAESFVKWHGTADMADLILGKSTLVSTRRRWREFRQLAVDSQRFDRWLKAAGAVWDNHRGKFIVQNPNPNPYPKSP